MKFDQILDAYLFSQCAPVIFGRLQHLSDINSRSRDGRTTVGNRTYVPRGAGVSPACVRPADNLHTHVTEEP